MPYTPYAVLSIVNYYSLYSLYGFLKIEGKMTGTSIKRIQSKQRSIAKPELMVGWYSRVPSDHLPFRKMKLLP